MNLCVSGAGAAFNKYPCAIRADQLRGVLFGLNPFDTTADVQQLLNEKKVVFVRGIIDSTPANVAAVNLTQGPYSEQSIGSKIGEQMIFKNDICIKNNIMSLVNKTGYVLFIVGGDSDGNGGFAMGADVSNKDVVRAIKATFTAADSPANFDNSATLVTTSITLVSEEPNDSFKFAKKMLAINPSDLITPVAIKIIADSDTTLKVLFDCSGGDYTAENPVFTATVNGSTVTVTPTVTAGKITYTLAPVAASGDTIALQFDDFDAESDGNLIGISDTIIFKKS
jgi:hypothetical protein